MKLSVFATLAATLSAGLVSAQATQDPTAYAAGLLQALQGANLTTLASLATTNAATLLPLLQGGNRTVFAPSDAAFAALPENVTSNSALVANTLLYHIYYGSYAPSNLSAAHTVGRSALNSTEYVNLPSNASQVAVLTSGQSGNSSQMANSTQMATVVQALSNVTSTAYTKYQNLDIYIIDEVLSIPQNLTATATAAGLTSLTGALTQYAPQAITTLSQEKGITVFAPVNSAFESAMSLIGTLNDTTIANVLLNHVIAGVVVYSPLISNGLNATSAGGATMSFMTNDTGVFVMSGQNATAQVIRADIPIANGVVHLIDRVLANPESNPAAASSAAASASSQAATNTQGATAAVTPTATGSNGGANGGGSSGGGTSGAQKLMVGGSIVGLVAGGLAVLF